MIPRKIHMIWTTRETGRDDDPLPGEVAERVEVYRRMFPACEVKCWSWADVQEALDDAEGRRIMAAARACTLAAMRVDLLRLAIVGRQGGTWSDVKNLPLMDFTTEYPAGKPLLLPEHFPIESHPIPAGRLCNGFFAAVPGNDFLRAATLAALDNIEARRPGGVFDLTGGGLFNRLVRRWSGSELFTVPWEILWQRWIRRTPMQYNAGALHWSKRQQTEPLYRSA